MPVRALCCVFAFAFIAAQLFTLHHAAAYGDEPHHHGEQSCTVQALAKSFSGLALADAAALPVPAGKAQKTILPARTPMRGRVLVRPHIRGPPRLSA